MHPTNCLNCGTILTADDQFCPSCGQKTNTHRFTLSHILHEFFHSFTHADKGFLGLTLDLAIKPGIVAREYIGGKRKKYFNPFTYYLLCTAIILFSVNLFTNLGQPLKADPKIVAKIPNEKSKQAYFKIINRTNTASAFMKRNLNTASNLFLPFYAFLSWIFFRRRGYNYSELLVAYMLFTSFSSLIIALFFTPWLGAIMKQGAKPILLYLGGATILIQIIYIGIAHYRFFQFKNPLYIILTSLVSLIGFIFLFTLIFMGQFYYIFGSNWWKVMKLTLQQMFN
ncbi:MAG TPA: DUF3667 domain-containing protein [Chitinophagaceae bacterium]|nr:DUF3667 domain-containing protein [Chitinophagaceae bacterium]